MCTMSRAQELENLLLIYDKDDDEKLGKAEGSSFCVNRVI